MPIICDQLDSHIVAGFNRRLSRLDPSHSLKRDEKESIFITQYGDYVIYQVKDKFYFHRIQYDLENTIVQDMNHNRNCLCLAITGFDDSNPIETVNYFIGQFGVPRWREFVEYLQIQTNENKLLLLKFPKLFAKNMLIKNQGSLKTFYYGPASVLSKVKQLKLTVESIDKRIGGLVGVNYGLEGYYYALNKHWDIVKEVIQNHKNSGICLKYVGDWTV